jgi:putative CocE/NonD family hydrolase
LDAGLTVIGAPHIILYVRSSAQSADFVARLCDVTPDGRSLHVTDAIARLSDIATPREVADDEVVRLEWNLWPTAYQFELGHRIRLVVTSGAHPRWARNLGQGDALLSATQHIRAEQTIHHDALHPSCLSLPVVD